ncbi:nicotinamide mononucleotide permease [Fusarium beomiforme]|uniref:Nicotinamide mononucleotide permease n=1 Tax=Fusarium beomiforme TaxID=44412 RepID=A0A9P5DWP4_9HYPO|nr:nicotinamide mononucleotide permease [Fusarium beomiforme]
MSEEKAQQSTFESVTDQRSPVTGERMTILTEAEEKAVLCKLDLHILPLLFLVYTFSNLDRSNLGNARLAGLPESMNLEGKRYDWLGTAFYIAYICSQWTAVGFKRFRPHKWVVFSAIGFSTISACQAAVTNYTSLVALRVLLGCFEGMFSGVPLYLSFFYPKDKVGFRQGIFLSGSALANAYGGVLGYAILGIRGPVAPWRCLFLIEGLPVWTVAILVWFYLPDDLLSAKFLTDREKEVAWQCIARGQTVDSQGAGGVRWAEWRSAFFDWRSYVPGLMYFSCNVCFGSLPLFIPTIISEMGDFDHQASNGLSAPPYILRFVMILACAFASDRVKLRGPFVAAAAIVSTVGYCLLGVSEGVTARYVGVFLSVQIFVSISILLPWVSSVHHTESKRAGGWAIFATLGQFGPLVGTNIFPKDQGPYYHKGAWISCGFTSLVLILSISYSLLLGWENKRLDKLMIEDTELGSGNSTRREQSILQATVEASPARSDLTAVGASSGAPIYTAVEPSLEDNSSCATRPDRSSSLSEILAREDVTMRQIDDCFARFFNHYSKLLPRIFNDNNANSESYFKESSLLFWAIIATGARHLEHATKLYQIAIQEIRGGIFHPLLHITNPIPIIKASLILCLWPPPQPLNVSSTSLCDGLPYFSIAESKHYQRRARIEEIVDASFHYRIKCHDILIDATRAFSDIINEQGEGSKSLLPLIKIFSEQVEGFPLALRNDLCHLTRCCTRLAISAYYFFLQSHELKKPGLISNFSIATEVLDAVSRLDAMQDLALHASNYYTRMALLAAFCILRIVRSPLREHIDLRDAEQSLFKAISFAKRRSMQHGDLDERYGTILSQLWSNSNSMDTTAANGLGLRIRSRLFMSVVFDSLWWWRVEYNGQGSPYDTNKTALESVQIDPPDATYWNSTATSIGSNFGLSTFPEVYMDWNFPLNVDYLG